MTRSAPTRVRAIAPVTGWSRERCGKWRGFSLGRGQCRGRWCGSRWRWSRRGGSDRERRRGRGGLGRCGRRLGGHRTHRRLCLRLRSRFRCGGQRCCGWCSGCLLRHGRGGQSFGGWLFVRNRRRHECSLRWQVVFRPAFLRARIHAACFLTRAPIARRVNRQHGRTAGGHQLVRYPTLAAAFRHSQPLTSSTSLPSTSFRRSALPSSLNTLPPSRAMVSAAAARSNGLTRKPKRAICILP